MNVLVNGFSDPDFKPFLKKILLDLPVDYAHLIVNKKVFTVPVEYSNSIDIVHFSDLSFADYSWVEWNALPPVDAKLLESLAEAESVFLKMMDRLEQHVGKMAYADRKRIFLRHVKYWNFILEEKKINFFLSQTIPHENYDFVIYSLCRLKNIPCFCFFQSMPDVIFYLSDYKEFMPELKTLYDQLKSIPEHDLKLSERAESLFQFYTSRDEDPVPFFMKKTSIHDSIQQQAGKTKSFFSRFLSVTFYRHMLRLRNWKIFVFGLKNKLYYPLKARKIKAYYNHHAIEPGLDNKYIYLPLHMQPELTTSPLAGPFVDQVLIAEMLSYCLPDDFKIYIKEHPKQEKIWGRNLNFYKDLKAVDKVEFIPIKYNSYTLIDHCVAVASATGRAGWEAIFKGKPALLFGHYFYQHAPGVFKIQSIDDCKKAVQYMLDPDKLPSTPKLKAFLAALDELTITGYYHNLYKTISNPISEEDNARALFTVVKNHLKASGN